MVTSFGGCEVMVDMKSAVEASVSVVNSGSCGRVEAGGIAVVSAKIYNEINCIVTEFLRFYY